MLHGVQESVCLSLQVTSLKEFLHLLATLSVLTFQATALARGSRQGMRTVCGRWASRWQRTRGGIAVGRLEC